MSETTIDLEREDLRVITISLARPDGADESFELEQPFDDPVPTDDEALQRIYQQEHDEIETVSKRRRLLNRVYGLIGGVVMVPAVYVTSPEINDASDKLATGCFAGLFVYLLAGEAFPMLERLGVNSRNEQRNNRMALIRDYRERQTIQDPLQ